MPYPKLYREIESMAEAALLENPTPRDIARKAGTISAGSSAPLVDIWGTFSAHNSDFGYTIDYPAGSYQFPDGTPSMSRYADMSGANEARLFVSVVSGGAPNVILTVSGLGEDVSVGLEHLVGVDNAFPSTWHPVTATGAALLEWTITADDPGSVTLGLCQLQVR